MSWQRDRNAQARGRVQRVVKVFTRVAVVILLKGIFLFDSVFISFRR